MDSIIILLLLYVFTMVMLDLIGRSFLNKKIDAIKKNSEVEEIKSIKYKTISEQLSYIDTTNKLYISYPLILILVTTGLLLFIIISGLIHNFIISLLGVLLWSFLYAQIIITLKKTENNTYYYGLISLYMIFLTTSIGIQKYYPTKMHFLILLIGYIILYIIWSKVKKWLLQ